MMIMMMKTMMMMMMRRRLLYVERGLMVGGEGEHKACKGVYYEESEQQVNRKGWIGLDWMYTKSGQLGLLSSQLEMVTFSRLLSRCTPHRNGNACCPVPLWTYQ